MIKEPFVKIFNRQGEEICRYQVPPDADGLVGANFFEADLKGACLDRANLAGASFLFACLDRATLKEADLYWAHLDGSSLKHADLEGASLLGAGCQDADFDGANLTRTNFGTDNLGRATELQGARLLNAVVTGAIFEGAKYDERTLFPEGFDPKGAGMELVPLKVA